VQEKLRYDSILQEPPAVTGCACLNGEFDADHLHGIIIIGNNPVGSDRRSPCVSEGENCSKRDEREKRINPNHVIDRKAYERSKG
jgi:hypothetical protein